MIDIRQTPMGGELRDFLNVVDLIYKDDPRYIRPLDMDVGDRLNPKKNPFFEHGEGTIFTAHKDGRCVGRVTAQIDREHQDRYKDHAGFFGFFDTIDDEQVARELLEAAENWLRDRGRKRIRGPISLNINEELGCLVEGFESPPVLMNPHHRPYQGGLIEKAGYGKAKDFFGWRYEIGEPNARVRKAMQEIEAMPEIVVRPFSKKTLAGDVKIALEVFNDAWNENWGFVPMTKKEADKMASDLKMFLVPEITKIVLIDGQPAAIAIALPNVNELIGDLGGKLFPFGIAKLLWRLKVEGAKSGRLIILGIKKKFRTQRKYAGLSLYLYGAMNNGGKAVGMTWGELGWTLEDNAAVNTGIKMVGAKKYKTYRVYEKALIKE
ncbi:MAG: hypothetical protein FWD69_11210 [Polyangiaceae bacterium]|nr:hypothetical protein [Polyangiaceae bacterium]